MTYIIPAKAKCECGWQGTAEEVKTKTIPYMRIYQHDGSIDCDIEYEPECPKCGSNDVEFS